MKTHPTPWLWAVTAGIALGVLAGCTSAPSAQRSGPAGVRQALGAGLRAGMTQLQVREILGEPAEVRPVRNSKAGTETWVYRRRAEQVEQKPTGTHDVPYVDPLTGQMRTIPEPTYSFATTTITEELFLHWFDGELVDWRTEYQNKRSYGN